MEGEGVSDFHLDRNEPAEKKFWRRIERRGDCWIWVAGRGGFGNRPSMKSGGKGINVRRLSWELQNKAPIPANFEVFVTCASELCVRHVEIRRVGSKPIHQNSIRTLAAYRANRTLPQAKIIPVYFHPEDLSNRAVASRTGVGEKKVGHLRATRESLPRKKTMALRSVVLREGVEACARAICGKYPSCPRCGEAMRSIDKMNRRARCNACGKWAKCDPRAVRVARLKYVPSSRARLFLEAIASGMSARRAAKAAGMANTTATKVRAVLFEEFGPPRQRVREL